MNGFRSWTLFAAVAAVAALVAQNSSAQAARPRSAGAMGAAGGVNAAGGTASAGIVRIRQFTGNGPRGLIKIPDVFPRGRTPARDWAEMQVLFDSESEWIDELVFVYYALLHDRATGEFTFLKGQVTHVDVARGAKHMSSAYIRPNTLARYGEVVAVAVEVLAGGDVVAAQSEGKLPKAQPLPADWWKTTKLVPKEGLVLAKPQTPFAYVGYDDYEAVK